MCKPKVDNSAAIYAQQQAAQARAAEEARAARIRQGSAAVDEQFSRFDDSFYDQRGQQFFDYHQPQLQRQYDDALADLTFALARAGTTNSSIAGQKMGDLRSRYDEQVASLATQRDSDVANLRSRVQDERSGVISQLNQTGDPDHAANMALTRSGQLYDQTPTQISLGDVFGQAAQGVGNYFAGQSSGNRLQAFNSITANNPRRSSGAVG